MIKKILLIFCSIFIGLLIIEFSLKFIGLKKADIYLWNKRYMFFSNNGEDVFYNKKNIFTYKPNSYISSKTYYDINNKFIKEYDYSFSTNNYGLVQSKNIKQDIQSTIFLGDSFTEGQGAEPWFNSLDFNIFKNEQVINGGLMGTGFIQWKILLDKLIEDNFKINEVYVIFISSDFIRGVWNFSNIESLCLKNYTLCDGNEGFYGLPNNDKKTLEFLIKVKNTREKDNNFSTASYLKKNFKEIRNLSRVARYKLRILRKKKNNKMIENEIAIKSMINLYESNIVFFHLPEKVEIYNNKKTLNGIMVENFIKKNTKEYYDLSLVCDFNLTDYHKYDGHFNSKGYQKLSRCIQKIISD